MRHAPPANSGGRMPMIMGPTSDAPSTDPNAYSQLAPWSTHQARDGGSTLSRAWQWGQSSRWLTVALLSTDRYLSCDRMARRRRPRIRGLPLYLRHLGAD